MEDASSPVLGQADRAPLAILIVLGAPAPTIAAAPPPPLDDCLAKGAFNLADCDRHGPAYGNKFGTIDRVSVHEIRRGVPIVLGFGGEPFGFDTPTRQCGDISCPRNAMLWRPERGGLDGSGLVLESG